MEKQSPAFKGESKMFGIVVSSEIGLIYLIGSIFAAPSTNAKFLPPMEELA